MAKAFHESRTPYQRMAWQKDIACGWSVVQLDLDEEMGPMHGMFGTFDAELQVQRTIRRAELTAFFCLLRRINPPHHGSCGQQRNQCSALERRNEVHCTPKRRTPTCGC